MFADDLLEPNQFLSPFQGIGSNAHPSQIAIEFDRVPYCGIQSGSLQWEDINHVVGSPSDGSVSFRHNILQPSPLGCTRVHKKMTVVSPEQGPVNDLRIGIRRGIHSLCH